MPRTAHNEARLSVSETPKASASNPQNTPPTAIEPWKARRNIAIARALTQPGNCRWNAAFKGEVKMIQAAPPNTNIGHTSDKASDQAAASIARAKTSVAPSTFVSREVFQRPRRPTDSPPSTAPTPRQPSR
ncbi:hypothetical protein D9M70_583860 [compost metagenome]